jgi:hypothetical protein
LNIWKATHCSIGFLVLSIASNSVQNAQSQALSNDNYDFLGYFSLGLLYLTLGFGCLSATAFMGKLGVKKSLMVGSICDTLWILCSLPPALKAENPDTDTFWTSNGLIYSVSIFSSVLDGIGDSIQWVA